MPTEPRGELQKYVGIQLTIGDELSALGDVGDRHLGLVHEETQSLRDSS